MHGGFLADFSAGQNREDCERSRGVVCDEKIFAAPIERDIARIFAEGWDLNELCQRAGLCIERE
jgi:hypothetical protein